jgi:hypothetical protein
VTELEGCHSISVRVKFAKTNRRSTLTVDGGRNTFPLPIRGRPRAGEGEASVSPDRKDLGPFADHPTRGPLSWLEWREPREGKRLRFYAPSGFLTFRIRFGKALAKTNEPVAKINHGSNLSCRGMRSTFRSRRWGSPRRHRSGEDRIDESRPR